MYICFAFQKYNFYWKTYLINPKPSYLIYLLKEIFFIYTFFKIIFARMYFLFLFGIKIC